MRAQRSRPAYSERHGEQRRRLQSESVPQWCVCRHSSKIKVPRGHYPRTVGSGCTVNGSGVAQRVATEGSPQDLACDLQDTPLLHPSVNHDLHVHLIIGDRCCVTLWCGRCGQHLAMV
ncbi:hypothetical protein E2C01_023082 [Portunus trituberculatus]|uniref:Uncharacterized protein n=1 Tax=Portunus trituberculatus TaxID=210409 RepID=A0A5B7E738_PORTR|nr:hypothetical protein [Portunus trituberculatus]